MSLNTKTQKERNYVGFKVTFQQQCLFQRWSCEKHGVLLAIEPTTLACNVSAITIGLFSTPQLIQETGYNPNKL